MKWFWVQGPKFESWWWCSLSITRKPMWSEHNVSWGKWPKVKQSQTCYAVSIHYRSCGKFQAGEGHVLIYVCSFAQKKIEKEEQRLDRREGMHKELHFRRLSLRCMWKRVGTLSLSIKGEPGQDSERRWTLMEKPKL